MKKIFAVAKWEYFEKLKTKSFLISLIVTPLILIVFTLGPTFLSGQKSLTTKAIGIIDTSRIYIKEMSRKLEQYKIDKNQPNYLLINFTQKNQTIDQLKKFADKNVLQNKIEGYLLILNSETDSVKISYRTNSAGNTTDINHFEQAFNEVRIKIHLENAGLDSTLIHAITKEIQINQIKLEEDGKESSTDFLAVFFSSFIFILLLVMIILSSGGMLVRSLVEEKSNRLIEILVSSCTPKQLLAGKILGLSSLGLTQIIIWGGIGFLLSGANAIPQSIFSNILPMLLYFLLGFFFYTSIFVGIGAIATTEQEAQQLTGYLSLLLLLPIIIALPAIENPGSALVQVLTYIPFTTPTVMLLKYNIAPVPFHEVIITSAIMLFATAVTISIAAKIFRIGILSYGKKPSFKELWEWLKEKDSLV